MPKGLSVNALLQTLRNLGPMRLAAMGGVAALLLGFFIYLTMRLSTPEMAMLYNELDLHDSGQIVQRLETMQVPFELRNNGAMVMVPADQVDRLRVTMAQAGLPAGGSIGYEIFDRSDGFGATNFMQNINRLRALEGELARTISTIANVRQARVHLVMPERELFSREQSAPTASVFLRLSGNGLAPEQILAIQHLVSAAVPRLQSRNISIVDDRGTLLASPSEGTPEEAANLTGEEQRRALERRLTETVEALLSRSVGFGRVRARVNVEMDFNRVTTSTETFNPEGQVVRSTQTVQDQTASNQGGGGQESVSVGSNLPEASALGAPAASGGPTNTTRRTEETTNYEISRTNQSTVRQGGVIRRLSVAVLVDGTYRQGEEGAAEYQARPQDEMNQLTALVRSAVGFSAERGDTVEVVNMRFASEEGGAESEAPATWLGMSMDRIYQLAELLILAVVGLLVLLLVVRPLVNRMLEGGGGAHGAQYDDLDGLLTDQSGLQRALAGPGLAVAGPGAPPELTGPEPSPTPDLDALIDLNQVEGRVRASSLRKVGEIVEKHPEDAVSIIRNWMFQDS